MQKLIKNNHLFMIIKIMMLEEKTIIILIYSAEIWEEVKETLKDLKNKKRKRIHINILNHIKKGKRGMIRSNFIFCFSSNS